MKQFSQNTKSLLKGLILSFTIIILVFTAYTVVLAVGGFNDPGGGVSWWDEPGEETEEYGYEAVCGDGKITVSESWTENCDIGLCYCSKVEQANGQYIEAGSKNPCNCAQANTCPAGETCIFPQVCEAEGYYGEKAANCTIQNLAGIDRCVLEPIAGAICVPGEVCGDGEINGALGSEECDLSHVIRKVLTLTECTIEGRDGNTYTGKKFNNRCTNDPYYNYYPDYNSSQCQLASTCLVCGDGYLIPELEDCDPGCVGEYETDACKAVKEDIVQGGDGKIVSLCNSTCHWQQSELVDVGDTCTIDENNIIHCDVCVPNCPAANTVACGITNTDPDGCGNFCNITGTKCDFGTCIAGDCVCTPICPSPSEVACGTTDTRANGCGANCNVAGTYCEFGTCVSGSCSCTPVCPNPNEVPCGTTDTRANGCGANCNVAGTYCADGTCQNGTCVTCGDIGQPCCEGNTCNSGNMCFEGSCYAGCSSSSGSSATWINCNGYDFYLASANNIDCNQVCSAIGKQVRSDSDGCRFLYGENIANAVCMHFNNTLSLDYERQSTVVSEKYDNGLCPWGYGNVGQSDMCRGTSNGKRICACEETAMPEGEQEIYITDYSSDKIIKIRDMQGVGWTTFGSEGSGQNQFYFPQGIAIGNDNKIYIAEYSNHRIVRIDDMTGAGWVAFGSFGTGLGNQFKYPNGITIDSNNKIYITDSGNDRIIRIENMTGAGYAVVGSEGAGQNQFNYPCDIAIGNDNKIYIADTGNHRIIRMDNMEGDGWITFGSEGSGQNQFDFPQGIAIGNDNKIYIVDHNHRIARIDDMTGAGWTSYGSFGTGDSQFNSPKKIKIDNNNKIYITDQGNHRIVRIDNMTGAGWTAFGSYGIGVNQFSSPWGIAINYIGEVDQCSDGTALNTCSTNKPLYCNSSGQLVDDCTQCGCPTGQTCQGGVCQGPVCGNGYLEAGEQCDDGNANDCDSCSNSCIVVYCGNGIVQCAEQCDDGNTVNNDGCSSTCQIEACINNQPISKQCSCGGTLVSSGWCCSGVYYANVPNDNLNCGSCGNACQSGYDCVNGVCQFAVSEIIIQGKSGTSEPDNNIISHLLIDSNTTDGFIDYDISQFNQSLVIDNETVVSYQKAYNSVTGGYDVKFTLSALLANHTYTLMIENTKDYNLYSYLSKLLINGATWADNAPSNITSSGRYCVIKFNPNISNGIITYYAGWNGCPVDDDSGVYDICTDMNYAPSLATCYNNNCEYYSDSLDNGDYILGYSDSNSSSFLKRYSNEGKNVQSYSTIDPGSRGISDIKRFSNNTSPSEFLMLYFSRTTGYPYTLRKYNSVTGSYIESELPSDANWQGAMTTLNDKTIVVASSDYDDRKLSLYFRNYSDLSAKTSIGTQGRVIPEIGGSPITVSYRQYNPMEIFTFSDGNFAVAFYQNDCKYIIIEFNPSGAIQRHMIYEITSITTPKCNDYEIEALATFLPTKEFALFIEYYKRGTSNDMTAYHYLDKVLRRYNSSWNLINEISIDNDKNLVDAIYASGNYFLGWNIGVDPSKAYFMNYDQNFNQQWASEILLSGSLGPGFSEEKITRFVLPGADRINVILGDKYSPTSFHTHLIQKIFDYNGNKFCGY